MSLRIMVCRELAQRITHLFFRVARKKFEVRFPAHQQPAILMRPSGVSPPLQSPIHAFPAVFEPIAILILKVPCTLIAHGHPLIYMPV